MEHMYTTNSLLTKVLKMATSSILILAFLGVVYGSDVIELTDTNFASRIKSMDLALVEFFAPWCGHCKRLAPEYEQAATTLKKNDPPVSLVKVDCVGEGKDTCSKNGVSGYPTLKVFRNGELQKDYDGPREASGIVSTMRKQAGPSSKEVTDVETMEKVLGGYDAILVGYFSSESDLKTEFLRSADSLRGKYRFAHTTNEAVMDAQGHKDEIVLYRPNRLKSKFEESKFVYSGSASRSSIEKFVEENIHGLVGHMTPDNQDSFKKPLVIAYFNVDYTLNPKGTNYWRNRVLKVARDFKDKLNFAIASKSEFSQEMESFGDRENSEEVLVGVKNYAGSKFVMPNKFSVDNFKQFVTDYLDGKIQPYIKSEDVPADNDGPVKVVVGKNFDEVVNDPEKDVLIEFYAPWCGHCKNLEPKYNELGEKFKDSKNIVIAKMDATANDSPPQYEVTGFPTLYWAPKNNKDKPEKYQGGREVSDFVEFIKKKATDPTDLPEDGGKKKKSSKDDGDL